MYVSLTVFFRSARNDSSKIPPNGIHSVTVVSPTDGRVLIACGVLRDPSTRQTGLVGPIVGALRLPRPLNPPSTLFKGDDLGLPVLPQEGLIGGAERRSAARFARAAAHVRRAGETAVVTSTRTTTVEVLGTVRRRRRPLADNDPQVESGDRCSVGAGRINVLLIRPRDLLQIV